MAELDLSRLRRIDVRDLADIAGIDRGHDEAILQLQLIKGSAPQLLRKREPPTSGAIKKEIDKINAAASRFLASTLHTGGAALSDLAYQNGKFDEIAGLQRERELHELYWEIQTLMTRLETETRGFDIETSPGPSPSRQKRVVVELCARFFDEYSQFTVSASERSRFSRFVHVLFGEAGFAQDVSRIIRDVVDDGRWGYAIDDK
ncbi:hypothetical protein LRP31_18740 [Mesorhizobium mediterraneum]|uniref:Uncharacterized protein n=1 Tax=Mesorhizobium mediterraneum TaxID=43617 RepID=A0AB36R9U0_9HYPH|nr:hypothetical protein [Mesorhizobium mediterraneum]PAQ01572.1 hypothetical protein CIT25_16180 [Mesorhizobium mediterraneum]RWN27886.1 MAG: hypothetical protein EOR96_33150 [Mesorhizobium sp.]WIW51131.1 hypothetical protein LRP31_18740 [Mesorhizobium mediterraneum]